MMQYCGKAVSFLSLALFLCVSGGLFHAAQAEGHVKLAENGKATAFILYTQPKPSPAVKQAIDDLKTYLGKISGAEFSSGSVLPAGYSGNVIIAGRLTPQIVKQFDLASRKVPPLKGSVMISTEKELLLAGSDDFGAVAAIYNFLEDSLGVHWWTPWDESFSKIATLEAPELDTIDSPSFPLGNEIETHSPAYSYRWAFRNRLSNWRLGDASAEDETSQCTAPDACNSLDSVLPMPVRRGNKKSTAFINSKRDPESLGLCWTSQSLQKYVAGKELLLIGKTDAACKKQGLPSPLFYYVGPDAGCAWCECEECVKVKTLDESNSGPVLEFVNGVASQIAKKYPKLLIAMPATQGARAVPQKTKPDENVMVVWFAQNMRISRPIVDKLNTAARLEFEGWTKIAANMGVYYYGDAAGYGDGLGGASGTGWPVATFFAFDKNVKYFKRFEAKYFHLEVHPTVFSDMPDLKLWMATRLLFDANRSAETELSTFVKGFYGPAGKFVRGYLSELQRFAQVTPGNVWYLGELPEHDFLTTEFLAIADGIWNQAAASVKDDAVLSQRVAAGRLSVDRAILALWPELVRQWLVASPKNTLKDMPIDRAAVLARYEQTMKTELARRTKELDDESRDLCNKTAAAELAAFKRNVYVAVKPAEPVFGAKPEEIFDYPAGGTNYIVVPGVKLFDDSSAQTGRAYRVEQGLAVEEPKQQFDPNIGYLGKTEDLKFEKAYEFPLLWGIQYKFSGRSGPSGKLPVDTIKYNGAGYHWYNLGRVGLSGNAYVYFFASRAIKVYFRQTGTFDVWARIKVVAPDITADADASPAFFLDRVTLVRPK